MKRRFYRTPLRRRIIYSLVVGCLLARIAYVVFLPGAKNLAVLSPGVYRFKDAIDACHVEIIDANEIDANENGEPDSFQIRIIGICSLTKNADWKRAARDQCSELCCDRLVRIRFDKRRIDVDGVWLAHVYVDDELLSYRLVERGMVAVKSNPSDSQSMIRRLEKAQALARQNRIGFWSGSAYPVPPFGKGLSPDAKAAH
ncbi:thermonuclease family protein [Planctomycetota bacterium]